VFGPIDRRGNLMARALTPQAVNLILILNEAADREGGPRSQGFPGLRLRVGDSIETVRHRMWIEFAAGDCSTA